jgi:RND family efflux transporter MFP subunit
MHGRLMSIASAAALALACGAHERPQAGPAPPVHPRAVSAVRVQRTATGGAAAVPALVQARERAALASRFAASVTALPYREGDRVAAGGVVARVDDTALRGGLAAAEALAAAAEADLARAQALLARGAATPRELEQASAAAGAARAQVAAARDNLAYATLRAPFAGRIAARRVNVGDVVSPGVPLVEIDGEGGLELQATVEPEVARALRPGMRLRALVDGQEPPVSATVTSVAPGGDPLTHRFQVKADLPAAAGLRPGLFARLLVPGRAAETGLQVPAAAVFERGGLTGVFVLAGGRARLRWVAPGAREGGALEIRAGVEEGEEVIVSPGDLQDGAAVSPR